LISKASADLKDEALTLIKVDRYNKNLHELATTTADIYHSFVSPSAPSQISLPHPVMEAVAHDIKFTVKSTLRQMESIFLEAQLHIENLVFTDVYPRFIKHQMAMSAAKALATDRSAYQGLGDCFCLTDPSYGRHLTLSAYLVH
jgi:phototropin